MYDAVLEELRNSRNTFRAPDLYTYVDATCAAHMIADEAREKDGTCNAFEKGELAEKEIAQWAARDLGARTGASHVHSRFKLLVGHIKSTQSDFRMPCSLPVFDALCTAWDLPEILLKSFGSVDSATPMLWENLTSAEEPRRLGIAIRYKQRRVAIAYFPTSKSTCCWVCFPRGQLPREENIIPILERCTEGLTNPAFVPVLLMEAAMRNAQLDTAYYLSKLESIENKLCLDPYTSHQEAAQLDNFELVDLTRNMTKLQTQVDKVKTCVTDVADGVQALSKLHQTYLETLTQNERQKVLPVEREIKQRLEFVSLQAKGENRGVDSFQVELRASVQTAYSLIGTNDSRLNYEAAMASLRIAEDSRKVAMLARSDSTDMRVIAGATLVFLPATFVATLFSTDFFNFQPSSGLVSHWIWLYCAVTALLTIAVMLVWRWLSKSRDAETAKLLSKTKDALERGIAENERDGGSASGVALEEIKNRLTRRSKGRAADDFAGV